MKKNYTETGCSCRITFKAPHPRVIALPPAGRLDVWTVSGWGALWLLALVTLVLVRLHGGS